MPSEFYTLATAAGRAKIAAAIANRTSLQLTHMAVGDGLNGAYYNPSEAQSSLKHEVYRAPLNGLDRDTANPAWIVAELVIPDDVGGFYVREVGIFDADGDLIFVGKYPESFKPTLSSGSNKQLYVRAVCEVGNAANVTLLIDPSVVLATRTYVDTRIMAEIGRLDAKLSARVATIGQTALTGLPTIDGVALAAGDRILVRAQTNPVQNGLYVAAAGAWARAADADAAIEVTPGLFVTIEEGTANGDSLWQLVTDGAIAPGVTALAFEMAAGRTGVSPAAYTKVTVNARGQVTAGVNPSTLAGYGITDAIPVAGGITAGQFSLAAAPTQGGHVATKSYVDGKIQGLDPKESVRVASTANLALTGLQTVDGVVLVAGDRILAKDQTAATENGLYVVTAGAWARSADADNADKVTSRLYVAVEAGTLNGGTSWTLLTTGAIVLGTTALNFGFFGRAGDLIAGGGLVKNGNQIDVVGAPGRIVVNGDNIDLGQMHAAAPGWWAKCRVDQWGRVIEVQALGAGDLPDHSHKIADVGGLQSALDAKAPTTNPRLFGTVEVKNGDVGWMTFNQGNDSCAGYVAFFTKEGVRRGYIGWGDGANLSLFAESGWGWSITGNVLAKGNLTAANLIAGGAGNGAYVQIGDDCRLVDVGEVHVIGVQSTTNGNVGFFRFGSNGNRFGWDGGNLVWGGAVLWHSGHFDPNGKANLSGASFWGDVYAPTFRRNSSRRVKRGIRLLEKDIDTGAIIDQFRGVSFIYKQGDGQRHLGGIAEEVVEYLPQAVGRDEKGRPDGVDYTEFVPVLLVDARKERKARRKDREDLLKQIAELNRRLARLERSAR
ncbi:phage tail-collar fiber domain-containing protein [Lysobacter sp. CA196]|uniref:phage tail-collar fiber domain-containing protein n=1 Tax=Lysobacter sp. CA196 TaxID=3455606 RepID=UPI003F8CF3AB